MKINNVLMLIFLAAFLVFFSLWYFKGSHTKKENRQLKEEIEIIQHQRDSLESVRKELMSDYEILVEELAQKEENLANTNKELEASKRKLDTARKNLAKVNQELEESKRKIEELKSNPKDPTNPELLEYFKNNQGI